MERRVPNKKFVKRDKDRPPMMKSNRYILPAGTKIEYKNLQVIQRYVTDRGKIVSRRISGVSASKQRELATAIRIARFLGLLSTGVKR